MGIVKPQSNVVYMMLHGYSKTPEQCCVYDAMGTVKPQSNVVYMMLHGYSKTTEQCCAYDATWVQ